MTLLVQLVPPGASPEISRSGYASSYFALSFHRPTEQILLGYFWGLVIRVLYQGGAGPGARSGPPLVQNE